MKKLFLIFSVFILTNCGEGNRKEENLANQDSSFSTADIDSLIVESKLDTMICLDTTEIDNLSKVNELIKSTENSDKKVTQIKVMKKENVSLKKELVETKKELVLVKKALDSTIQINEEKKKKGFIKTIVDSFKKDSVK
jgi:hypothetical protein